MEAKDEAALIKIASRLDINGIDYTLFFEPDNNTGYTSITAGPIYNDDRKMFKKFKFYKE